MFPTEFKEAPLEAGASYLLELANEYATRLIRKILGW